MVAFNMTPVKLGENGENQVVTHFALVAYFAPGKPKKMKYFYK